MNAVAYSPWFYLPFAFLLCSVSVFGLYQLIKKYFFARQSASRTLSDTINLLLPQTQCGQCGYNGCRPYADAIAAGERINRCPPGGQSTINSLAMLLGDAAVELNPNNGCYAEPVVARIREAECIGCTKCIQVCPVDAILGAAKLMHTVIEDQCTGCDLCRAPCPVDCIDLVAAPRLPRPGWRLPTRTFNAQLLPGAGQSL